MKRVLIGILYFFGYRRFVKEPLMARNFLKNVIKVPV